MIPRDATLTIERLSLDRIVITRGDHWPHHLDIERIEHYASLLARDPSAETDPIMVVPLGNGLYTPTNGRHRFLAALVEGREMIWAVIVQAAAGPCCSEY